MEIPTLPKGFTFYEANERVTAIEPDLITRSLWRAERRCRKLNESIIFPSYRWEVKWDLTAEKWVVVAMQNRIRKVTLTNQPE